MRILFIQHAGVIGGSTKSLRALIQEGLAYGWDIHVIVTSQAVINDYQTFLPIEKIHLINSLPTFDHHSAHVFKLNIRDALRVIYRCILLARHIPKINTLIKNINPDAIHLNSSVLIPYLPFLRRGRSSIGVHIRERIAAGFPKMILTQLVNRYSDFLIYISPVEQKIFPTKIKNARVIFNFINTKDIPKRSPTLKPPPTTILSLGGCSSIKGYHEIISAAVALGDQVHFKIVGENLLNTSSPIIPPNVTISPSTSTPLAEIAKSDFLIFWTNQPHFPRPVYESWLVGVPCIVSQSMLTQPDIDNSTAIIGIADDTDALVTAIKTAIAQKDHLHHIINKAREVASEKFTEKNFIEIINIYDSVLKPSTQVGKS